MPVISMFYGIIVLLYYFDHRKHHRPHIPVQYSDEEAVISIPDGDVIEGSLRTAKLKLVRHGLRFIRRNSWRIGGWR